MQLTKIHGMDDCKAGSQRIVPDAIEQPSHKKARR
jgi:hypothetical protein